METEGGSYTEAGPQLSPIKLVSAPADRTPPPPRPRDGGQAPGHQGRSRTGVRTRSLSAVGSDTAADRASLSRRGASRTVYLHVRLQVLAPDEGLVADGTDVGPLAGLPGACERPSSPVRATTDFDRRTEQPR